MNILQVCAYAAPYEGNFLKSLYALDNRLETMSHTTIYAFCEYAKDKPWVKDLQKRRKVYFLPQRYARINPATYIKLRRILKREKIDIVHSHFELYDLPLGMVTPKKCKMFWHLHDTIEANYLKLPAHRKLMFKLHYKTFSKNAVLCSVSKRHMRFVISLGFDEGRALYIPNGTDFSRLIKSESEKKYDFLIFAWDYQRKGADVAIKAAKRLSDDGYQFKIGFVGNEALWKKEEIISVQNESWFVKQDFVENISDLYNSTRSFLHISRAEGCSYAMLEAVYFGLPMISSNIEENLFLNDIPLITFVETGSIEETYYAMKKMLDNGFNVDSGDVEKAKKAIIDQYSLDAWVDNIIKVYCNYVSLETIYINNLN